MLVLFKPWRSGTQLKSVEQTWNTAFETYELSERHSAVIKNFNLRYECLDARDDFRAEMAKDAGNPGLHPMFDDNITGAALMDLDADCDDYSADDYGITSTDLPNFIHGVSYKRKLVKAAKISRIMGDRGCKWSTPVEALADTSNIPSEIIATHHSPGQWKETVATLRQTILDARQSTNQGKNPITAKYSKRYVNQVEFLTRAHLQKQQNSGNETDKVNDISDIVALEFGLNKEQERAYRIIVQHTQSPLPDQLRMYIGGMGGTGKTQVLKAVMKYFDSKEESHRMIRVAPTGTASSLVKGSTYHFMFGINEFASGEVSKKTLGEVKARLQGIEYIFFDEVSMLSCADLYKISARLAMCTNNADLPFGGMNVIFAGDFAQLPPVIGGENSSLYRPDNGMYATSNKAQGSALGKAIWHQVVTVVILRENMRQKVQTPEDARLRQALANMRYKACTAADISFLRSRVCNTRPGAPDITSAQFRNTSIITGLNVHKDEFNRIGSVRFAVETGQELTHFYSDDSITDAPASSARTKKKAKTVKLTGHLQRQLWESKPSDTNKHIPGKLSICKGLPMMIRYNMATELSITKGQECTVYSWVEGIGSVGQPVLETLFVRLINPPSSVSIPGLPENVVPLVRSSQSVTCFLPDDSTLSINRTQIEIIPNFAMTDYCSQGKTRPVNPVDLTNCRSHQSYYTALSRSASSEGTVLLPDFTDPHLTAFDPKKIQGGCSGHLRQEFRELELLDHITLMMYEGTLSMKVHGDRRYDLIERFQLQYGKVFVPPLVEKSIKWSLIDPMQPSECSTFEWDVKKMTHVPVGMDGSSARLADTARTSATQDTIIHPPYKAVPDAADRYPVDKKVTPMKHPGKRKARTSDNAHPSASSVATENSNRLPVPAGPLYPSAMYPTGPDERRVPIGCAWASNSCPYDVVLFILINIWKRDPAVFTDGFSDMNEDWMGTLASSLSDHHKGVYSVEQVRDFLRRKLHRSFPEVFVYSRETSASAIVERWFKQSTPVSVIGNRCDNGHEKDTYTSHFCGLTPIVHELNGVHSVREYASNMQNGYEYQACVMCYAPSFRFRRFIYRPIVLPVHVEDLNIFPDSQLVLPVVGIDRTYELIGAVYYGEHHFTSRYVDRQRVVWYNNSIVHRRNCVKEGHLNDMDLRTLPDGRKATIYFYVLL
ncbi:uncharacterized protein ARMOST_21872 [Armillaria ostoyae]|uniref:ATP-dependent DNA helicase n=1 Tax=Armillaria ostoyae TaxID=47428 RepID=A0A284SB96_ARMOS|nr:uncharacterized protein ARMOST_21872 [Armillaria ostoyae]